MCCSYSHRQGSKNVFAFLPERVYIAVASTEVFVRPCMFMKFSVRVLTDGLMDFY